MHCQGISIKRGLVTLPRTGIVQVAPYISALMLVGVVTFSVTRLIATIPAILILSAVLAGTIPADQYEALAVVEKKKIETLPCTVGFF